MSCPPRYRICGSGMVHGRMKPAEKQAVMAQFKAGEAGSAGCHHGD